MRSSTGRRRAPSVWAAAAARPWPPASAAASWRRSSTRRRSDRWPSRPASSRPAFGSSFFGSGLGSGFFSTGFSTGFGASGAVVEVTTSFLSILPTASSTGLASATLSTSGFLFSFLPLLMPAVIFEVSSIEMSTGMMSSGVGASSERVEKENRAHPSTSTCKANGHCRPLALAQSLDEILRRHEPCSGTTTMLAR